MEDIFLHRASKRGARETEGKLVARKESLFPYPSLRRGVVHAFVGLSIATALLFYPRIIVIIGLAVMTAIFVSMEVARLRLPIFNRWFFRLVRSVVRDEEESRLTGASYLLMGALLTATVFPRDIAVVSMVFLALGDPTAGVVGRWKGRTRLWKKSLEGGVACLAICLLSASLIAKITGMPSFVAAAVGAISATIFQALPFKLNDNLTIPLGSAVAMLLAGLVI